MRFLYISRLAHPDIALLMHHDYIARQRQRDVLGVEFHNRSAGFMLDYTLNPARKTILEWLTANDIPYFERSPCASQTHFDSYCGQIHIDIPYDKSNPAFQKEEAFLDTPDGTSGFEGAWFVYWPLDLCMKNAHHDLPGFWESSMAKF